MARLTPTEIQKHRGWLSEWRRPARMSAYVDEVINALGSADLFTQGGLEFVRDAWNAAKFARGRQAEKVRLVADKWPDFEIAIDGVTERFEAIEADLPNRRRGDEYREAAANAARGESLVRDDPVEDWIARAELVPTVLADACRRKLSKNYSGWVGLVIYLNIGEYGIRQKEIQAVFPTATREAGQSFASVWVLWKDRVYLVWEKGKDVFTPTPSQLRRAGP